MPRSSPVAQPLGRHPIESELHAAQPWPTSGAELLRACLRRAARPLTAAMASSMIRQFAFLAIPYLIGRAIDDVIASDLSALAGWCGLLLLAVAVEFAGLCGWIWWANAAEMRIASQLREAMLDVALAARPASSRSHDAPASDHARDAQASGSTGELDGTAGGLADPTGMGGVGDPVGTGSSDDRVGVGGVGDLVERVVGDVDAVLIWVHGLATWVVIATTVAVLVPAIVAMHVSLLAVTGVCVVLLTIASVAFPRADRPRVTRLAQVQGRRSQHVSELLATALTVRGFGGQHRLVERHHASSADVTASRLSVARLRAWWDSTSEGLPQLAVAAGLAVGAWAALHGDLAVGQIATFAMWMGTVQRATVAATNRLGAYSAARASAARMAEVLALAHPASAPRGVTVSRPASLEGLALHRVQVERSGWRVGPMDTELGRGRWCVVTGATGTGKSTLLAAVMGLVPSTGRIGLDGIDLTAAGPDERASWMTLVPQQPLLLHGSVRDNLLLGAEPGSDTSDARLLAVCHTAVFDEVLDGMPAGLDTAVGERGAQLSGGQRARLAVARALLRPGPLLLFDDVSSALDVATEARMIRRLRKAASDRIVVWASHRPAVIAEADTTIRLEIGA